MTVRTKIVKIEVVRHRTTGLLVAMSDDLPGLMVHGRTDEEIDERLEGAVRELLEAEGKTVVDIEVTPAEDGLPKGFVTGAVIASARLAYAE